jgi:hypothetical protein
VDDLELFGTEACAEDTPLGERSDYRRRFQGYTPWEYFAMTVERLARG